MWESEIEFVNGEHRKVYVQTKDIPGWQAPGDTQRLYEMAFKAGDVILEIGTYAGRSATVELRGALANPERKISPMYFGIDINVTAVIRTLKYLEDQHLLQHALAYHGDLGSFVKAFDIQPTMVFVDGDHRYDGVKQDLTILADFLVPETPVLCHDYTNVQNETGEIGVRRAVDEFVAAGWAQLIGVSGCSAFLVTTEKCRGRYQPRWSQQKFDQRKIDLLWPQTRKLYRMLEYRERELNTIKQELEETTAAA